ncbi:hypothetical protein BB561_003108 [Smittium simulii]|uniref:Brl1/Brr6 domain-containing protein n=1 Tax=Smittium simulii TaxID=133385 RepID=A0A2T9YN43_9FUNG|nr:hypothetical protein BB561_003108 [Smittium simulii]
MNFRFASTKDIFPNTASNRGKEAPMDIDRPDEECSWLKLDPTGEPPRKRSFLEANIFGSAKKTNSSKKDGYGIGGHFLFKAPATMSKIREIDYEKMDVDVNKPIYRSQDSQPISPNAVRKVNKDRNFLYSNALKSDKTKTHTLESIKNQELTSLDKLVLTPSKKTSTPNTRKVAESISSDTDDSIDIKTPTKQKNRKGDMKISNKSSFKEQNSNHICPNNTISKNMQVHRDIPFLVSGYFQLFFNILMATLFLVIIVQIVRTIYNDIDKKAQEYTREIINEIAACAKNYKDNRCEPHTRVPAMEANCIAWLNCMNRDPTTLGSTYRKNRIYQSESKLPFPKESSGS